MNSTQEDTLFGFDLDFLQPTTNNIPVQALKQRYIGQIKRRIIRVDALNRHCNDLKLDLANKNKELEFLKFKLDSTTQEHTQTSLEYKDVLENYSKCEAECTNLKAAINTYQDKYHEAENRVLAGNSHVVQLQQLIKEYERKIDIMEKSEKRKTEKLMRERAERELMMCKRRHDKEMAEWQVKYNALQKRLDDMSAKLNKQIPAKAEKDHDLLSLGEHSEIEDNMSVGSLSPLSIQDSYQNKEDTHQRRSSESKHNICNDVCETIDSKTESVSLDTGYGSSLASSDNEKWLNSPDYLFSPIQGETVENNHGRKLEGVANNLILVGKRIEIATSPLPSVKTVEIATSPIIIEEVACNPILIGTKIEAATSPLPSVTMVNCAISPITIEEVTINPILIGKKIEVATSPLPSMAMVDVATSTITMEEIAPNPIIIGKKVEAPSSPLPSVTMIDVACSPITIEEVASNPILLGKRIERATSPLPTGNVADFTINPITIISDICTNCEHLSKPVVTKDISVSPIVFDITNMELSEPNNTEDLSVCPIIFNNNDVVSPVPNKNENTESICPIETLQTSSHLDNSDFDSDVDVQDIFHINIQEKDCLELNSSKTVEQDRFNDQEIEMILNTMRLDYSVLTPIPRTPKKAATSLKSSDYDNHSACACPDAAIAKDQSAAAMKEAATAKKDAAKTTEAHNMIIAQLANLMKDMVYVKSVLKGKFTTADAELSTQDNSSSLENLYEIGNEININDDYHPLFNSVEHLQNSETAADVINRSLNSTPDPLVMDISEETDSENIDREYRNSDVILKPVQESEVEKCDSRKSIAQECNSRKSIAQECNARKSTGQECNSTDSSILYPISIEVESKSPTKECKNKTVKKVAKLTNLGKYRKKCEVRNRKIKRGTPPLKKPRMKLKPVPNHGVKKVTSSDSSATLNDKQIYAKAVKVMAELKAKNAKDSKDTVSNKTSHQEHITIASPPKETASNKTSHQEQISITSPPKSTVSNKTSYEEHITISSPPKETVSNETSHQVHIPIVNPPKDTVSNRTSHQEQIPIASPPKETVSNKTSYHEHISIASPPKETVSNKTSQQVHISIASPPKEPVLNKTSHQKHIPIASPFKGVSNRTSYQEHITIASPPKETLSSKTSQLVYIPIANPPKGTVSNKTSRQLHIPIASPPSVLRGITSPNPVVAITPLSPKVITSLMEVSSPISKITSLISEPNSTRSERTSSTRKVTTATPTKRSLMEVSSPIADITSPKSESDSPRSRRASLTPKVTAAEPTRRSLRFSKTSVESTDPVNISQEQNTSSMTLRSLRSPKPRAISPKREPISSTPTKSCPTNSFAPIRRSARRSALAASPMSSTTFPDMDTASLKSTTLKSGVTTPTTCVNSLSPTFVSPSSVKPVSTYSDMTINSKSVSDVSDNCTELAKELSKRVPARKRELSSGGDSQCKRVLRSNSIQSLNSEEHANVNDAFNKESLPTRVSTSENWHIKESILCAMIQKYGKKKLKPTFRNVPEAVLKNISDKIENFMSKIQENQNNNDTSMNELVDELKTLNYKNLVSGLVHYLTKPERKMELFGKMLAPPAPQMTRSEAVLLYVIRHLRTYWPVDLVQTILSSLEHTLFKLNRTPEFEVIESVSHFYALVCRYFSLQSRLKTFMLDAMYCILFKSAPLIKQCLEVWPHIIPLAHLSAAKIPLVTIFVYLLHFYKCEDRFNRVQDIRFLLQKKYHYQLSEWNEKKILDLVSNSISDLRDIPCERKMVRFAIIILGKRHGPRWTQNNIMKKLFQFIEKDNVPEHITAFCLSMIGPLMKPYPVDMKLHCGIAINQLTDMLKTTRSKRIEEAIMSSMIIMSRHNSQRVNEMLLNRKIGPMSPEFEEVLHGYIKMKPLHVWLKTLSRPCIQVEKEI